MHLSTVVSFAALLSACTEALAAPDAKVKTVTKKTTLTFTKTATTTLTKRRKRTTTTVTETDVTTETQCANPGLTSTRTETETETHCAKPTVTSTSTETETDTKTETETATETDTKTQTETQTQTSTETATETKTATETSTARETSTETKTSTSTTTVTPSPSPSCQAAVGYAPGGLLVTTNDFSTNVFLNYCNGGRAAFQDDGNLVIYPGNDNSGSGWTPFTQGAYCTSSGCKVEFTSDGNFQVVKYGSVRFSSNTRGKNAQRLILSSGQPYVTIYDNKGAVIYTSGVGAAARRFSVDALPPRKKGGKDH